MEYNINERFIAEEGQDTIKLSKPYIANSIIIYKNKVLCDVTEYTEVDNYTVVFKEALLEGDIINVISLFSDDKKKVDVISTNSFNSSSIFKKYGKEQTLMLNQKYHIRIKIKDETNDFSFVSKLDPLLSNCKAIRVETGELLNDVPDEHILLLLHKNSVEAIELYDENKEDDYSSEETTTIPRIVKNWAKYKTCLDLCYSFYLTLSGKYGSVNKVIGADINIQKTIKLPYLSDLISRFKDKFDKADELMKDGGTYPVSTGVRAGSTTYSAVDGRVKF